MHHCQHPPFYNRKKEEKRRIEESSKQLPLFVTISDFKHSPLLV
jgi:hypothetical protein